MGKKIGLIAAVVAVLGLSIAIVASLFFGPTDAQLIKDTLSESTAAAARGETSEVLDGISRNFQYGDDTADRFEISKYVKNAKPKITILDINPQIEGNVATVKSDVMVAADFLGMNMNQTVPNVTITLEKEITFRSFLPAKKWRVTSVQAEALPGY